jgi:hypothetical protein
MSDRPEGQEAGTRLRAAAAVAAAVLLAAVVAVVLVVSGGSGVDHEFDPAPEACVDGWNGDRFAVTLGKHQSVGHNYINVQVLTLSGDYSEPVAEGEPGAACAVIFASSSLDPEIAAAGSVRRRGRWEELSGFVDPSELAELQIEAQGAYNARLGSDGIITPL